jgi:hypothetical protein
MLPLAKEVPAGSVPVLEAGGVEPVPELGGVEPVPELGGVEPVPELGGVEPVPELGGVEVGDGIQQDFWMPGAGSPKTLLSQYTPFVNVFDTFCEVVLAP